MWESRVHTQTHIFTLVGCITTKENDIYNAKLHGWLNVTIENLLLNWMSADSGKGTFLANSFYILSFNLIEWSISQTLTHEWIRKWNLYEKTLENSSVLHFSVSFFHTPLIVIRFNRYWLNLRKKKKRKQSIILIKKPKKRKEIHT